MRRLRLLAALGAAVLGLHALLLVWFGERLRASTAPDPAIERLSAVYTREIAQSLPPTARPFMNMIAPTAITMRMVRMIQPPVISGRFAKSLRLMRRS